MSAVGLSLVGLAPATVQAAAVTLAPQHAGSFATGTGADASFVRINSDWQGSAVLWDEDQRKYGSGTPIGSFSWGTGI